MSRFVIIFALLQLYICRVKCFWMGQDTLRVPMRLFTLNRTELCETLKADQSVPQGAIVLLEGGKQEMRYCSDHEPIFRQVYSLH